MHVRTHAHRFSVQTQFQETKRAPSKKNDERVKMKNVIGRIQKTCENNLHELRVTIDIIRYLWGNDYMDTMKVLFV